MMAIWILFLLISPIFFKPVDLQTMTMTRHLMDTVTLPGDTDEPCEIRGEVIYQIVVKLNWTSVRIYTDNVTEEWSGLLELLTQAGAYRVTVMSRLNSRNFHNLATNGFFDDTDGRLHIILCQVDCVQRVISLVTNEVSEKFLFSSKWLVATNSSLSETMTGKLENVAYVYSRLIPGELHCSVVLMTQVITNGTKMFKPVHSANACGNENHVYESATSRDRVFPNLHRGLGGRTISVGVEEWYPYILKTDSGGFTGFGIDMVEEFSKVMNFRIKYVELSDKNYVWQKFYRMLENKEIDILACPLMYSRNRARFMDFTYQVGFNQLRAFYKQPTEVDLRWRLLIDLLSWPVIALTLSTLLCLAVVLGMFQSVHSNGQSLACSRLVLEELGDRVGHISWFLFANLLNQGQIVPLRKPLSGRWVIAAWCIFCLILTVTFTAYLVPALGVVRHPVLFKTLRDLIDHGGYKWGMYGDGNFMVPYLRDSVKKDDRDLYEGLVKINKTDPEVLSQIVAVHERKVLTENYVYINAAASTQKFYAKNCHVVFIEEKILEIPTAFPLPKKSPFKHLFSHWLVVFNENGLMENWRRKWLPERGCVVEKTKSTALDLLYLQSVFILTICGVALSLVVFLCETLLQRYLLFKRKKMDQGDKTNGKVRSKQGTVREKYKCREMVDV